MIMDVNEIAQETNDMLVRRFVAAIGYDYHQDYSPHLYPKFSEDTVMLWNEIERRLQAPTCLDFDKDGTIAEIRAEAQKQTDILRGGPDYASSYHYGVRSGLQLALRIIEDHVRAADA